MKKLKSSNTPPVTEIYWPTTEGPGETIRQYVTRTVDKNESTRHAILLAKGWRFLGYSDQHGKAYYANMNIINGVETFTQLSAFTLQVYFEVFSANLDNPDCRKILHNKDWWMNYHDSRIPRASKKNANPLFSRQLANYELEAGVS
jgi:hypothetical protein